MVCCQLCPASYALHLVFCSPPHCINSHRDAPFCLCPAPLSAPLATMFISFTLRSNIIITLLCLRVDELTIRYLQARIRVAGFVRLYTHVHISMTIMKISSLYSALVLPCSSSLMSYTVRLLYQRVWGTAPSFLDGHPLIKRALSSPPLTSTTTS